MLADNQNAVEGGDGKLRNRVLRAGAEKTDQAKK